VPITDYEIPELCSNIDLMIKENREILAIDTVFNPVFEKIQQFRVIIEKELKQISINNYIEALKLHGVNDKNSLIRNGPSWLRSIELPPYGRGCAFAGSVLGGSFNTLTVSIIKEVADKLELPELSEETTQQFIQALAVHGINDKYTLLTNGVICLKSAEFKSYGKGYAFIGAILGKTIYSISVPILEEVAGKLNLPELSEETKQQFIQALAVHDVTDRQSLFIKGQKWLNSPKAKFPPYGSGREFFGSVLGSPIKRITIPILDEMVNILNLSELSEETTQQFIQALAADDINDKRSLRKNGLSWFKSATFLPYGYGPTFVEGLLGRPIEKITIQILEEIANKLDLPELSAETIKNFIQTLSVYGINDRQTLLQKGPVWFKSTKFLHYGSGKVFVGAVIGRSCKDVTIPILEEVADTLGFEKKSLELKRNEQIKLLSKHGITDRSSLRQKGPAWFNQSKEAKFLTYGSGRAFVGAVLGRTIKSVSITILEEVADTLTLPKLTAKNILKFREALAAHGVTDQNTILQKGSSWFKLDAKFPSYGGGSAFLGAILGRSIRRITIPILEEVADTLGFEKKHSFEEERKFQIKLLAEYGITDRFSLANKSVNWFMSKEVSFSRYGGGRAFIGAILGRTIKSVSITILEEVADALGFEKISFEEERKIQIELLAKHRITDRISLINKGSTWFNSKAARFSIYGGGLAFTGAVLGKSVKRVTIPILEELANKLGL